MISANYDWKPAPEEFRGPRSIEDLPLYEWTRRILRAGNRLKGRTFPRRMKEQPVGLSGRMEHKTPQFFLRNLSRTEVFVDDSPGFEKVETRDPVAEHVVEEMLSMRYKPPALIEQWNIDKVKRVRATFRRLLYEDDWARHFCRELKDEVRGPLYKYDPDRDQRDGEKQH